MPFSYGIRNIATKETWRANSGKTNWRTSGHAKLAWNSSMTYHYRRPDGITSERFDDQALYEIFKYGQDEEAKLKKAEELLAWAADYLEDVHAGESDVAEAIREYFKESEDA